MSLLEVGRRVNPDRYSTLYDLNKLLLAAGVVAPIAFDVQSNNSYFKFNIDYANLYNLVRLESGALKDLYQQAYTLLRAHTADHQNAFFNMVDRALNGPDPARDAETITLLNAWLERPRRDVFVDLRGKLPSCNQPDQACSPVPVPLRPTTDFIWQRNPFNLTGGGQGTIETAGIDYILPYWMARFYGVLQSSGVVSAASGNAAVSAESIASYYGSNLSTMTAAASSLPLPTSLGGISLKVKDSAGSVRLAPLFYVSPTQINFEIPAGVATGQATLKVINASGSIVNSATVNVSAVAPALFTADASGKGVAAAVAIHVIGGQQFTILIFQCSNGACSAIPIDLGLDTPTYLSLYGTGIRNRSAVENVTVTIHGVSVPVRHAGPQGAFAGLDQVNVALPLTLRGAGETDLVLTVDGQRANTVRVNIQ